MTPVGDRRFPPLAVIPGAGAADHSLVNGQQHRTADDQPLAMRLLAAGVPLSLLLDLADPGGLAGDGTSDGDRATHL